MVKVFLILLIALLFGGGGFAGGWYLFAKKDGAVAVAAPPPPPPVNAAPVFVKVGPLILPVIGTTRVEQFITLVVDLEVGDDTTADKLRVEMPRVEDAFLQTLYGGFATGTLLDHGIVNVVEVKSRLTAAVQKMFGNNIVRNVLIQVVTQRPV